MKEHGAIEVQSPVKEKIPERYRVKFTMDPTNKNQKSDMIQLAKPTPPTLDFQSRGRLGEPTQGIIS